MEELLNRLFESREVAHGLHLKSKSQSEHLALDEYYTTIVDLFDGLVETYQGQYGIITGDYELMKRDVKSNDIGKYFEELVAFVKKKKKEIIKEENEHLITPIDDIIILIYTTIYKVKNLK